MLVSKGCLLFVVCCLLFVVCCLLFVVCCLLFVVCCLGGSAQVFDRGDDLGFVNHTSMYFKSFPFH